MTEDDSDPDPAPDLEPDGVSVEISDTQSHWKIDREALARLVRATLVAQGVSRGDISLAIVDDPTIQALNRRHLNHDWPTDVITFPLSEPGDDELSGELVLSAETALTTAKRAGVEPRDELALYVVHGLLHLCGYDDRDDAGREAMRRRESEILAREGLSNTFASVLDSDESESRTDGGRERARCMA